MFPFYFFPKFAFQARFGPSTETSSRQPATPAQGRWHPANKEEGLRSYRPGGLCPIDIGDCLVERYRVLHKLAWVPNGPSQYTSWVARDMKSSKVVQLDVFLSRTSSGVAVRRPEFVFKSFLMSLDASESRFFQKALTEHWINSPNGRHYCRVLELGFVNSDMWNEMLNDDGGYTVHKARRQALSLSSGVALLHEHGYIHGDICTRNIVFTAFQLRYLSNGEVGRLLGEPKTVSTTGYIGETGESADTGQVPRYTQLELDPTDVMKLDHVAVIKAFPPTLKNHFYASRRWTSNSSPEHIFGKSMMYFPSDDVWAVGCVIFELVTGVNPFPKLTEASALSNFQGTLGAIPGYLQRRWNIPKEAHDEEYSKRELRRSIRDRLREREYAHPDGNLPLAGTNQADAVPCHEERNSIKQKATKVTTRPLLSDEEYELIADLLEQILIYDSEKRPTMSEVLKHPWFERMEKRKRY
ncbi:MAG: hypothetical protein M4579_004451 [Chaenotheca gracillima]|nr:MAG: hypothetical protein M4579_004451 [Chaenotheca gracillima]